MDAGLGRGGIEAGLGRGGMPAGVGPGPPPPAAGGRCCRPPWMPNGLLPAPRAGGRPPGPGTRTGTPGAPGRPAAGEPGRGGTAAGTRTRAGTGPPSAGGSRRTVVPLLLAGGLRGLDRGLLLGLQRGGTRLGGRHLDVVGARRLGDRGRRLRRTGDRTLGLRTGCRRGRPPGRHRLGRDPGRARGRGRRRGRVDAVVGAGAAGAAAGAGAPADATNALRSRRATGASTVLDADFTNSPISFSLARTVLLSTPSSFASSCTRALPATALLTPRSCGQHPQRPHSCT